MRYELDEVFIQRIVTNVYRERKSRKTQPERVLVYTPDGLPEYKLVNGTPIQTKRMVPTARENPNNDLNNIDHARSRAHCEMLVRRSLNYHAVPNDVQAEVDSFIHEVRNQPEPKPVSWDCGLLFPMD